MARSLPKGDEPWKTFEITVRVVRGRAEVYAAVRLSSVTGVVGTPMPRARPIWEGVIARREMDRHTSPEECAVWAQGALEKAFPSLF